VKLGTQPMPRGLPKVVATHLEKAKESALLAVEVYNKPGTKFRSGGYIVLICIAWTSLFHAIFFKRKSKPFYRMKEKPTRFQKVDGDYKAWELATCIDEYFGGQHSPVRENLRFLIGLRNKIEHRSMPELDHWIFGECQACLLNFEDVLFNEFGTKHCMNESLVLAIQFSRLRNEFKTQAVAPLHKPLQKQIASYVESFRSSLSTRTVEDLRFSYKVFLIPKVVNHQGQADVAVEFIKYDPSDPQQLDRYEKVVALIRPTVSQVANAGKLKAGDVCRRVEPIVKEACGRDCRFNPSYHHALACEHYKVRPKKGGPDPAKTKVDYCQYDAAHKDYVYTEQWVAFLIAEMKKPGVYQKMLECRKTRQARLTS
jgi:hypothetical protein